MLNIEDAIRASTRTVKDGARQRQRMFYVFHCVGCESEIAVPKQLFTRHSGRCRSCASSDPLRARRSGHKPNRAIHFAEGVTVIALECRNGDVLPCYIETADYDLVKEFRWVVRTTHSNTYAATHVRKPDGKQGILQMHRLILKPDASEYTDHINHVGTDNRRSNLRLCTNAQNSMNQNKQRRITSSQFKGVSWFKQACLWEAYIHSHGKKIRLGHFDTAEEAAATYDEAAKKYFGEFAKLNFPTTAALPLAA